MKRTVAMLMALIVVAPAVLGVHPAGIIEGLRKLYGTDALVAELLGSGR